MNLLTMSKDELEDYALNMFNIDIDKRKSKAKLISQIKELQKEEAEMVKEEKKEYETYKETEKETKKKLEDFKGVVEVPECCGTSMKLIDKVETHPTGERYISYYCDICRKGITLMG